MNFLWESWLGTFTDTTDEAITNKAQGKGVDEYQHLMARSLAECYRVLRPDHWMLLVFMNSSSTIWTALRTAVIDAGFIIRQADIFDKQHGTFKQFVSDNTAGCDLVLHCLKPANGQTTLTPLTGQSARDSVSAFLRANLDPAKHTITYLHVGREQETDVRSLYSLWVAQAIMGNAQLIDFASFRAMVEEWLLENHYVATS